MRNYSGFNAAEAYHGENFQTRSNTRRFAFIRIQNETKHRFNCVRDRTAIRCHHSLLDSKHEVSLFRKRHSVCIRVRPAIYYPPVFEIAVETQTTLGTINETFRIVNEVSLFARCVQKLLR